MSAPFPTRKNEAYRYADFDALKAIWDTLPAPDRIEIAAQQNVQQIWFPSGEDVQVRNVEIALEAGASCTIFALNMASEYSRIALDVKLAENAHFALHAANIGGGDSTLEIVTTIRHLAPAATSRQTVRSVLGGKATGSYVGKVAVARDAQQTDSEQSVKAMLLDRGATANCKPELEIFADDVKCAHGASVGELDPAQLFYAQSRGLDPAAARALLLEGFIAGLWDDVADDVQRADIAAASRRAEGDRVNIETRLNSALDVSAQFPAIANWHYLDSAATAQKPQSVIDAINDAYARDYATVHRAVYQRSADMTVAYEAARAATATLLGGQDANEVVFTRGATEAINLVARSYPRGTRNRVLLSALEHHSNIVPWQLAGYEVDVCPLTADHRIDLDAAEAMLTEQHAIVAFAHVSNVLGSILDARRAADLAHGVGAKLLLDGCQAAPRIEVDVAAIDCDFYVFSGHKLYGPTGIGALWARAEILDSMPPMHGGGAMIDRVTFAKTTYAPAPQRFEAGTPHIVGAIGLHAAINWIESIGLDAIHAHEVALVGQTRAALSAIPGLTLFGPEDSAGIVSFAVDGVHPHDVATILDDEGVAIRAGHHCAQPLMELLGVPATARASFAAHSDASDIAALVRGVEKVKRIFG